MMRRGLSAAGHMVHDVGTRHGRCLGSSRMEAKMPLDRTTEMRRTPVYFALIAFASVALLACQPTVKVEAPKEPITINLNIKIDAEVRVKLEETAKEDIEANPGIF